MQRLCGGGLRSYLGNGSEADIDSRQATRRVSGANQISFARGRESGSAVRSNALGDEREVSRGHITGDENRGAGRCPFKQRLPQRGSAREIAKRTCRAAKRIYPQARSGKDRTGTIARPDHSVVAMNPIGGAENGMSGRIGAQRR